MLISIFFWRGCFSTHKSYTHDLINVAVDICAQVLYLTVSLPTVVTPVTKDKNRKLGKPASNILWTSIIMTHD